MVAAPQPPEIVASALAARTRLGVLLPWLLGQEDHHPWVLGRAPALPIRSPAVGDDARRRDRDLTLTAGSPGADPIGDATGEPPER